MPKEKNQLAVYRGYGHTQNLVVYGHVFKKRANLKQRFKKGLLVNFFHLLRLFKVKPYPYAKVQLSFRGQTVQSQCAKDGFFKLEWQATENVEAGLHTVNVIAFSPNGKQLAQANGEVFVPHVTQHAFISDIDDTIMISHSSKLIRRLKELFINNPRSRKTFQSAKNHYDLLVNAHTTPTQPNPFFYVSSSEWNLYDYLNETFRYHGLPNGCFLLNNIKRLKDLLKTGKTGHEGKLLRVMRILDAFPKQQFVLFGDNSQMDPQIYTSIAERYPQNIVAVYIRNVRKSRMLDTQKLLAKLEQKNIHTCLFKHSDEAIAHSRKIGLIS